MVVQILGIDRSNCVRTVRMIAHEKGVPYELVIEMPHSEAVKAINPFGLVPVLRHDGLDIAESQAIGRYLDAIGDGPALVPSDAVAAAKVNYAISTVATNVDKILLRQYVVPYAFHRDDEGNVIRTDIDKAIKRFPRVFGTLSAMVADGYCAGAEFSMADCFLMPILAATQMFPEGKAAVAEHAAVAEYFARVAQRESFASSAPA